MNNSVKISEIKKRILQFIEIQHISKYEFCKKTGIGKSNLSGNSLKSELGGAQISQILNHYSNISPDWLLIGKGEMFRDTASTLEVSNMEAMKKIPLVTQAAVAGFGNADFSISQEDVKDYYVVPKFKYCNIDFMIEISGSSMYPKYNSGDVVACTILRESKFIQWNKCHIIATREQGILCKRLRPSNKENFITAISDNQQYPPFDIPIDEILGIALVVGVIRLE
ncbi:MAG: helix-turn-helix transcriptional regulator [Bacteroidales bacterium]|nr:helix-turn-helix transcriptional regulator [Bacteroidales bacterium]MCR5555787.1 S24 family peptidase [Bacteroidales bacterium]